jgi:hypothetical protein
VTIPVHSPGPRKPPAWAVEQAAGEFDDVADPQTITKRAWELVQEANERYDERHDEYDDPDEGGEA